MRKLVALVSILAIVVITTSAPVDAGETAAAKVLKSVARVEMTMPATSADEPAASGICTAFSINQSQGFWLTAAHCYATYIKVNGQLATPIYYSEVSDLMVLRVDGYHAPALKYSHEPLALGQTVYALGYGYGILMLRTGHVSNIGVQPPFLPDGQLVVLQDIGLIGGMSGGPVFNEYGEVVSINQMGQDAPPLGLGRILKIIVDETKQFWK